jgi:hypothetical protein
VAGGEHAEIEDAVEKELAAMSIGGTLVLVGKSIELRPAEGGAPVSIEIEQILGQWPLLPAEMQKRKAVEVAQRLAGAHRFSRRIEGKVKAPAVDTSWIRIVGVAGALFGVLGLIGLLRYAVPRLTPEPPPDPRAGSESTEARGARLARSCDAMRVNLYNGSPLGPLSADGWVVELWLASKDRKGEPLLTHPALAALVANGKLAASADTGLAAIRDGAVEITGGLDDEAAGRSPGWSAATVVFRDGYGRAFFEEGQRSRFTALAERVAQATGADDAALYARCAHLPSTHDVGAWFHGPDLAGATTALLYQMGFFAEARLIDRSALAAGGSKSELDALRKAAGDLGDAAERAVVGEQGASVTTAHGATVVFPFATPVRSVTATRDLARRMGIAVAGSH